MGSGKGLVSTFVLGYTSNGVNCYREMRRRPWVSSRRRKCSCQRVPTVDSGQSKSNRKSPCTHTFYLENPDRRIYMT